MIGFVVRSGFWITLTLLAVPSSRNYIISQGYSPQSFVWAAGLAFEDMSSLCSHQVSICNTATDMASEYALAARDQVQDAYHGIRTQFDGPDRQIMTGSIRKQQHSR